PINTGRYESKTDFWIGERIGKSVTIQFGKIGRTGIRAAREFSTPKEAEEFLNSRLKDKIEDGFLPV
ncbi:MAG: WGR domain-containing protein, partial [Candidatus Thorarchaeota archaeon]|nr:WGR domain-containing protein [Candidatus Thorarchaeota archaeon]